MKSMVSFKGFALILLVLFTITLPNRFLITKFKAPLTLTELDISDLEVKKIVTAGLFVLCVQLCLITEAKVSNPPLVSPQFQSNIIANPSLNFLYLTHSPPVLC